MPICEAVYRVLHEDLPAQLAVEALLSREPRSERPRARERQPDPAHPCWRHASYTATATALERLRLRTPGRIGMRRRDSGANSSMIACGSPAVSQPKTSTSPGANRAS